MRIFLTAGGLGLGGINHRDSRAAAGLWCGLSCRLRLTDCSGNSQGVYLVIDDNPAPLAAHFVFLASANAASA